MASWIPKGSRSRYLFAQNSARRKRLAYRRILAGVEPLASIHPEICRSALASIFRLISDQNRGGTAPARFWPLACWHLNDVINAFSLWFVCDLSHMGRNEAELRSEVRNTKDACLFNRHLPVLPSSWLHAHIDSIDRCMTREYHLDKNVTTMLYFWQSI